MTEHAHTAPGCQWVGPRQTDPDLTPGDSVKLCTAQRVWTVNSVDGNWVTITARDTWMDDLTVHVAHLERVETAGTDEHGEIPGQETFDLGDVA